MKEYKSCAAGMRMYKALKRIRDLPPLTCSVESKFMETQQWKAMVRDLQTIARVAMIKPK